MDVVKITNLISNFTFDWAFGADDYPFNEKIISLPLLIVEWIVIILYFICILWWMIPLRIIYNILKEIKFESKE